MVYHKIFFYLEISASENNLMKINLKLQNFIYKECNKIMITKDKNCISKESRFNRIQLSN